MLNFMSLQVKEPPMKYHGAENIGSGVVYSILGCLLPVAPPGGEGGSFPPMGGRPKIM